jgi:hypothetical protein
MPAQKTRKPRSSRRPKKSEFRRLKDRPQGRLRHRQPDQADHHEGDEQDAAERVFSLLANCERSQRPIGGAGRLCHIVCEHSEKYPLRRNGDLPSYCFCGGSFFCPSRSSHKLMYERKVLYRIIHNVIRPMSVQSFSATDSFEEILSNMPKNGHKNPINMTLIISHFFSFHFTASTFLTQAES